MANSIRYASKSAITSGDIADTDIFPLTHDPNGENDGDRKITKSDLATAVHNDIAGLDTKTSFTASSDMVLVNSNGKTYKGTIENFAKCIDSGTKRVQLTQAEYNALIEAGTVNEDTFYEITDSSDTDVMAKLDDTSTTASNVWSASKTNSTIEAKVTPYNSSSKTVVDTVADGNMNPVTSNAVNDTLTKYIQTYGSRYLSANGINIDELKPSIVWINAYSSVFYGTYPVTSCHLTIISQGESQNTQCCNQIAIRSNDGAMWYRHRDDPTLVWGSWIVTNSKYDTYTINYNGANFVFSLYTDKIVVSCDDAFTTTTTTSDWVNIGTIEDLSLSKTYYASMITNGGVYLKILIQSDGKVLLYSAGTLSGWVQDEAIIYL